jgi:hypothetical protein
MCLRRPPRAVRPPCRAPRMQRRIGAFGVGDRLHIDCEDEERQYEAPARGFDRRRLRLCLVLSGRHAVGVHHLSFDTRRRAQEGSTSDANTSMQTACGLRGVRRTRSRTSEVSRALAHARHRVAHSQMDCASSSAACFTALSLKLMLYDHWTLLLSAVSCIRCRCTAPECATHASASSVAAPAAASAGTFPVIILTHCACGDEFDEERVTGSAAQKARQARFVPRRLPCGHTHCTGCIAALIQSTDRK